MIRLLRLTPFAPVAVGLMILLFLPLSLGALPPQMTARPGNIETYDKYDLTGFYDANQLLMFVTNSGSVAMDQSLLFDRPDGFYYPYTGDTSDIRNDSLNGTVVYAAGLVLTGIVNGAVRTAAAVYDNPEFVPGPMADGSFVPYEERFKVFKIDSASGPGDYDYDNWPESLGAPVDNGGEPLLIGDQTLWTLFNDADPALHDNYFGGGTEPLGVEVQQTVWGYDSPEEENFLYIKYKFYNRGGNSIDSFYINFWADPDIGGPGDDLIGCDTLHDLFFALNGDGFSPVYGDVPPAWGGKVISGPVVSSPGDTADFDGAPLPDHKNIGMTSFSSYINGTEPDTPEELLLYSRGLDGFYGTPYINPANDDTVTYYACGDPLTRRGYIDNTPGDKRIMTGFGPFTFNPGDSQQVVLKLAAYAERDNFFSLSVLRNLLDSNIAIDSVFDTVDYVAADSAQILVKSRGLEKVSFVPLKERWLSAYIWGGNFFLGGADYGSRFLGSALDPLVMPDSFHSVEIRFSNTIKQKAYRYDKGVASEYMYAGYYDVPFTVWDIDSDRQLNVAFVEYYLSDVYDSTWGPGMVDDKGGWEWLVIFNSDYSGDTPGGNGVVDYTQISLLDNTDSLDILYFLWPGVETEDALSRLDDGQKLVFAGQFLNPEGVVDTLKFPIVEEGSGCDQSVTIKSFAGGPSLLGLEFSDPGAFSASKTDLRFVGYDEISVSLDFTPYRSGEYNEYLYIIDSLTGRAVDTINLYGRTHVVTAVEDDIQLLPSVFELSQNYPNPFNPETRIEFSLAARADVSISIYNILGRRVKTLIDENRPAGTYTVIWDGTDRGGYHVASGIYLYRMQAGEFIQTRKMLLLR